MIVSGFGTWQRPGPYRFTNKSLMGELKTITMKKKSKHWPQKQAVRFEIGKSREKYLKVLIGKFGRICWYCGAGSDFHIDHIVPIVHGGGNDWDNLALTCKFCNTVKLGWPVEDFFAWIDHIRSENFKRLFRPGDPHPLSSMYYEKRDEEISIVQPDESPLLAKKNGNSGTKIAPKICANSKCRVEFRGINNHRIYCSGKCAVQVRVNRYWTRRVASQSKSVLP